MQCHFCHAELDDKGMLMTTGDVEKYWSCSDCFVKKRIEGRAEILHHWGYAEEEEEPDKELTEE